MKAGTTFSLVLKLIQKPKAIDEVIFTITNGKNKLTKSQNGADDGIYSIGINQEESELIKGSAMIEAQINYADKSVDKSLVKEIKVRDTLNTTPVDGNMPSGDDGVELVLECIEKGVALLITPESADELIESVTALFQDTKSIAQSVRDDADAGKFDGKDGADGKDGKDGIDGKDGKDGIDGKDGADGIDGVDGQDGFSPTVSVKTQTSDTYILDITDKNGTIETPNLQGQKGDKGDKGDTAYYQDGNGIDITGDTISVDLASDNLLHFYNGKLWLNGYDLKDSQASDNMLVVDNGARGLKITPQIIGTNVDVQYGIAQGSKTRETLLGHFGDGYNIQQRFAPIPTANDNGKFLRVNAQGNAEWQTVPSAESEVY